MLSIRLVTGVIVLAKCAIVVLLILLLLLYLFGFAVSGALGEADDAKGPILFIGPLSVFVSLFAIWRFWRWLAAWILALLVLTDPFWSVALFGRASDHHLAPFWAEAAVVITSPLWAFCLFDAQRRIEGFFERHSANKPAV